MAEKNLIKIYINAISAKRVDILIRHIKELEEELLKLRIIENFFLITKKTSFRGRSSNERTARIIISLRRQFKLKDLLSYTEMPKATFMYWQKDLIEKILIRNWKKKILEIRKVHTNYSYRRILGELLTQNIVVNKKKVQRIMQKLGIQVALFTRKSLNYSSKML